MTAAVAAVVDIHLIRAWPRGRREIDGCSQTWQYWQPTPSCPAISCIVYVV
jgi:hypothetical protein